MVISKYLDTIEGTEKEPILLNCFDDLKGDKDIEKLLTAPIIGKLLGGLIALSNSESIEAFRRTEHYDNIKDWNIMVFNLEKGYVSIHPGPKHIKKFFVVAAGVLLLKLRCKHKLSIEA